MFEVIYCIKELGKFCNANIGSFESTGQLYESRKLRPDERQMTFNLNVAN